MSDVLCSSEVLSFFEGWIDWMTKCKMVFGGMLIERELFEVGETCRLKVSSVIWEFYLNMTRTTEAHNTAVKAVSHHMDFWRNLVAEGTNTLAE